MTVATPSGKDKVLKYARLFVDGYNLSGDARTVGGMPIEREAIDMTGWSNTIKQFLTGYRSVGIQDLQVLLNDAAGRGFAILKDAQNLYSVSVLFGGGGEPAIGDPAYLIPAVQMSDSISFDAGAALLSGLNFLPSSSDAGANYGNPLGICLHPETLLSGSILTPDAHDIGSDIVSTSLGWSANIHIVTTASGVFAFKIEHSTDDISYADLGTFTVTGGTVEAEHLTGSGTVNRYVRISITWTSGTCTPVVSFARNFNG